jgi:hypothetical protein
MLKAVFTHHLHVRRETRGLTVSLEATPESPARAAQPVAPHDDQRALLMHAALRAALDAAPTSRKVFRHLATVEHHLWRKGTLFLHDLSLRALQRTVDQLDGVATPPLTPWLAALRECLVDAIATQERLQSQDEMLQPRSSFFVDHKIEVQEATASDFARAVGAHALD